jgi:hypothetical protein
MKTSSRRKKAARRVLRLPDLDYAKRAVLNTLGSPESKRAYECAIDDFVAWYCSEPRLAFCKTVVLRYRLDLEGTPAGPGYDQLALSGGTSAGLQSFKNGLSNCSVPLPCAKPRKKTSPFPPAHHRMQPSAASRIFDRLRRRVTRP